MLNYNKYNITIYIAYALSKIIEFKNINITRVILYNTM